MCTPIYIKPGMFADCLHCKELVPKVIVGIQKSPENKNTLKTTF